MLPRKIQVFFICLLVVFVLGLLGFNFASYGNFCENEYCAVLIAKHNRRVFPNPEVAWGFKYLPLRDLLKDVKIHPETYTPWLVNTLRLLKDKNLTKKICGVLG